MNFSQAEINRFMGHTHQQCHKLSLENVEALSLAFSLS